MSPSCYVTKRQTQSGPRYVVRYREGGRHFPVIHAGSFKTMKEARARRDLIAGEIAAGRDPMLALRRAPQKRRQLIQVFDEFQASRVDVSASTLAVYRAACSAIVDELGEATDPATITPADVRALVTKLTVKLKPATVESYMTVLRQVLDFVSIDPNPARDRTVKLPARVKDEPTPPTARQYLAILERMPVKLRPVLVLVEQTAARIGEVVPRTWGDVDVPGNMIRLPRSGTKTRQPRWVQVPAWLMGILADTCPVEDRTASRRLFPDVTRGQVGKALERAARAAQVPVFSPHDFRHRRASLWHGQGVPAAELAKRLGHARPSMSLDVYSHVMPLDEASSEALGRLLVRSP